MRVFDYNAYHELFTVANYAYEIQSAHEAGLTWLVEWFLNRRRYHRALRAIIDNDDRRKQIVSQIVSWNFLERCYQDMRQIGGCDEVRQWERKDSPRAIKEIEALVTSLEELAWINAACLMAIPENFLPSLSNAKHLESVYRRFLRGDFFWPFSQPKPYIVCPEHASTHE